MKKKILLALILTVVFTCLFVIGVSAETPTNYIEFGAKFPGSDSYITVYTENAESTGNPKIDFASKKFYSDVEFTQEVDMSTATGIDFSVTKTYASGVQGNPVTRMVKPSSPFVNCVEVKWFLEGMPSVSYNGSFFKGWTALKSFDFGNATSIADNTFEGCGLESVTIPASVTSFGGSSFKGCTSLKSVKIEGCVTKFGNGDTFNGCTALETVDLGSTTTTGTRMFKGCTSLKTVNIAQITYFGTSVFEGCTSLTSVEISANVTTIKENAFLGCTGITSAKLNEGVTYVGQSMFSGCTSLASLSLPTTITEIKSNAFTDCAITSITIPENVTKIGSQAFLRTGITSLHIPAKVTTLGYQVAESTPITSLTFAENSQLTFIDHRAFMDCDSLVGPVILPDGLIEIDYGLFSGCALLKAVKMPDTVTTITGDAALFNSCPKLEYVQFSKNLTGTIFRSMFEGCTSLKAVSFPDGITTIDYKALRSCTSLEAVYLPASLTNLGRVSNNSSSDWGVFYQSPKVYLVNEPFDVFDGNTLIGDNFKMPSKQEIYYMPENLAVVGNSEFQNCTNLNNYIVFPEGVTSMADCGQGAFYNIGTGRASNPVTLVFLGDITDIIIRQNENASSSNVYFVFANKNDKDFTSMNFIIGAANNKLQTNTYAYFCASNTVYDLSTFKAENATKYTVLDTDFTKTVNTDETQPHFHNPKADKTSEATCELPAGSFTFCFCGKVMTSDIVEGSVALGHISEGAELTIYYPTVNDANGNAVINYFANAYHSFVCQRVDCGKTVDEQQPNTALFTEKGYSKENGGNTFTYGIKINKDAKEAYVANGNTISYGFIVGAYSEDTTGAIINADGTTTLKTVVMADLSKANLENFTIYNVKMKDLTSDQKSQSIYCCGYVIDDGEVSYLGETVTKIAGVISYDAIPADTTSTDEKESA